MCIYNSMNWKKNSEERMRITLVYHRNAYPMPRTQTFDAYPFRGQLGYPWVSRQRVPVGVTEVVCN